MKERVVVGGGLVVVGDGLVVVGDGLVVVGDGLVGGGGKVGFFALLSPLTGKEVEKLHFPGKLLTY